MALISGMVRCSTFISGFPTETDAQHVSVT